MMTSLLNTFKSIFRPEDNAICQEDITRLEKEYHDLLKNIAVLSQEYHDLCCTLKMLKQPALLRPQGNAPRGFEGLTAITECYEGIYDKPKNPKDKKPTPSGSRKKK